MLEELILQLKKEYVDTFPEKVRILREFSEKKLVAELENEFHKMKGTGKTYGLPEMSLFGALFESVCAEKPPTEALAELPKAIALLTNIYEARCKDEAFAIEENSDYKRLFASIKPPQKE